MGNLLSVLQCGFIFLFRSNGYPPPKHIPAQPLQEDNADSEVVEGSRNKNCEHDGLIPLQLHWRTLRATYEQSWTLAVLEESIATLRELTTTISDQEPVESVLTLRCPESREDPATGPWCQYQMALSLGDRFDHTGQVSDIDKSLRLLQAIAVGDSTTDVFVQGQIGALYGRRYVQTRDSSDAKTAFTINSAAVARAPPGSHVRAWCLHQLGQAFKRHIREDITVLDAWLTVQREAVLLSSSQSWHPWAQLDLSDALTWKVIRTGKSICLDEALKLQKDLLDTIPRSHRDYGEVLMGHSRALFHYFQTTDEMGNLVAPIDHARQALACITRASPRYLSYAYNLSILLQQRFVNNPDIDLDALDEATELSRMCLEIDPTNGRVISGVANMLSSRHDVTRNEADLDDAIMMYRQAKPYISPSTPAWGGFVRSFSAVLMDRFVFRGLIEDCLESVTLLRQALENPLKHALHEDILRSDLVFVLLTIHTHNKDVDALIEATHLCAPWKVNLDEAGIQSELWHKSIVIKALAMVATERYSSGGEIADLEAGIVFWERAIELNPRLDPLELSAPLSLAKLYQQRAMLNDSSTDAFKALQLISDSLRCVHSEDNFKIAPLLQQAKAFLVPVIDVLNVDSALESVFQAVTILENYCARRHVLEVVDLLRQLNEHTGKSTDLQQREKLLFLYQRIITLLPRVAHIGLDSNLRLRALAGDIEPLAVDAAFCALRASQPTLAVELLEQGRAIFWRHHLQLRMERDGIPEAMAVKLTKMASMLDVGSNVAYKAPEGDDDASKAGSEREAVRLKRLGFEFESLLSEIRALPGLGYFLLPEPFSLLSAAAVQGPIAVLLANDESCSAIVIGQSGMAQHVELPGALPRVLQDLATSMNTANALGRNGAGQRVSRINLGMPRGRMVEQVLHYLWVNVGQLLVNVLELEPAEGTHRPRLVLCPTGGFTRLPLHAAGLYESSNPSSCSMSTFCVTSYTPTIGALLYARRKLSALPLANVNMVLAAVTQPPDDRRLLHASEEVAQVQRLIPSGVNAKLLSDTDEAGQRSQLPTITNVVHELPSTALLHLACHGHQDALSPLESGFVMSDGKLTVARLLSLKLDRAFFSFLGACETAKGDRAQPDQAVHLAATMLFAGFRSIIGTTWSMDDVDGPEVATTVYTELFKPGVDVLRAEAIPYALDLAVQRLRQKGLCASRWAPYVHLGA